MLDILQPLIDKFLPFAAKRMGFNKPPRLFLKNDSKNGSEPLGKTAYYDPSQNSVTLYVAGRHPKDVMRSLSHELVHHTQNCRGAFDSVGEMGEGYAQNDEHLREMEREAYEIGNMCFRDWEDSLKSTTYYEHLQKGENKMSLKDWKNKEIKSLLSEAWGFKMDLGKLNEGSDQGGSADATKDVAGKASGYAADDEDEDEALEELANARQPDERRKPHGAGNRVEDEPKAKAKDEKDEKDEKDYVTEDGGHEEGEHYEDNAMNDEDHIKAIEHHLRALKRDKDHDDDHIEEGGAAARQGNEEKDIGRNRMHADRVHEQLKNTLKELIAAKKKARKHK